MATHCPTDVVKGSAERIWSHLVEPYEMAKWTGGKLKEAPTAPLAVGDRVVLGLSRGDLVFVVREIESNRRVAFEVFLPLGIRLHEVVQVRPLADGSCRVTLNCDFQFPSGVKGYLLERTVGLHVQKHPAMMLNKLKTHVERSAASSA